MHQIYGDQDADGFYIGECNGHRGLVPSNMVSLVEVDDPDLALQLLREGNQSLVANGSVSSSRASSRTSGVTTRTVSTVSQQGKVFSLYDLSVIVVSFFAFIRLPITFVDFLYLEVLQCLQVSSVSIIVCDGL